MLLQTELQGLGESTWVIQLMNSTTATAFSINATQKTMCHDKFGHWCLGKHLLILTKTHCFVLQHMDWELASTV